MTELTGIDALNALDHIADQVNNNEPVALPTKGQVENGESPVLPSLEPYEPKPVTLPPGYQFRELTQGHLLDFYEHFSFEGLAKAGEQSGFHHNQYTCLAAIKANWFKTPASLGEDSLRSMDWSEPRQLCAAILNHLQNLVNTPKN